MEKLKFDEMQTPPLREQVKEFVRRRTLDPKEMERALNSMNWGDMALSFRVHEEGAVKVVQFLQGGHPIDTISV